MIRFKAVIPSAFKNNFDREILKRQERVAGRLLREFQRTTRFFNHTVPFQKEATPRYASVITNDPPYFYIQEGTRVKFVGVSKDFKPKTARGRLTSVRGAGKVFPSRTPRPGIKARKHHELIAKEQKPFVIRQYQEAIKSAVISSTHKYR